MKHIGIPRDYWDWRCSALLLVLVVPVVPLTWLATDQPHRLMGAASLDGLVRGPSAVAAALCFWVAWRISAKPQLGWLVAVGSVIALPAIVTSGLQLGSSDPAVGATLALAVVTCLVLLVIVGLGLAARRVAAHAEPLWWGIALGLGLGLAKLLALSFLPEESASALGWPVLVAAYLVLAVPAFYLVAAMPGVPSWASGRVALGVLLYGAAHLLTYLGGGQPTTVISVLTLVVDVVGATNLAAAGVAVLRMAMSTENQDRDQLLLRVGELEADHRVDRARIHEINSMIAGVVSASRMLRDNDRIAPDRRLLLDNMVQAELARLQRLLADPDGAGPAVVDLDDTLANLVLAHEVRGNRVDWLPSGARVTAEPDAVTEVLNILLDNAAKHGSNGTSVTVNALPDEVEVVVSDDGPGIAPEVRPHLFDWGARGPRSRGQGIGLHIAHDLTARHGGHLRLRDSAAHGATFVATFPRARRGDDEPAHIA